MDLEAASASIRSSQYNGPTSANSQDIFSLARHARVSEVEELLIRGVPITSRDENGNGILSIACQNGSRRTAKLALRFGADINEQNCSGNTPLHYCCLYQKKSLARYLIEKGADTSIRNKEGRLYSEV
jgi:ankyrin repeat protein